MFSSFFRAICSLETERYIKLSLRTPINAFSNVLSNNLIGRSISHTNSPVDSALCVVERQ